MKALRGRGTRAGAGVDEEEDEAVDEELDVPMLLLLLLGHIHICVDSAKVEDVPGIMERLLAAGSRDALLIKGNPKESGQQRR